MKHLFILVFVITFVFFGTELGYTTSSPWYTHITYMFQHGNLMHLFLNSLGFIFVSKSLQHWYSMRQILAVSLLSAFLMSFFVYYDKPVVGSSGIVYAMMGMYAWHVLFVLFFSRPRDVAPAYMVIMAIIIMLGLSFTKENSAGMLHLACLIAGVICAGVIRTIHFVKQFNKVQNETD